MRDIWRAVRLLVGTAVRAEPRRVAAATTLDLLDILALPLIAVGLKYLADGVIEGKVHYVVVGTVLIAGIKCLSSVTGWLSTEVRIKLGERVAFAFDQEIATISAGIPGIEHQERADYQDKLELVRRGRPEFAASLQELLMVVGEVVGALAVLVVLFWLDPLLLLFAIFGLPAIAVAVWQERWYAISEERSAAHHRLARHLRATIRDRDAGMETRVFGLHDAIRIRLRQAGHNALRPFLWATHRAAITNTAWQTVLAIGYVGAIGVLLWRAANGHATVGDVVAAVFLCRQVADMIVGPAFEVAKLGSTMRAAKRLLWLRDYAASAAGGDGDQPVPHRLTSGIVFDNVTFTYPGTDRTVLWTVSLTIPAGHVVALVGDNGVGKTTMVKLLTRMYEPTSGRILVDGANLTDLNVQQWRARLAAAFQDYLKLETVARHTVGVGDLPRLDSENAVLAALNRAEATDIVHELPHQLDTQLGSRWDGGMDPSTGQWQKLALARALMRDDPLVVFLDEPTASLDATTEHALFARYADNARRRSGSGAITILVSHRFSTVRSADLIVVLDHSGGVESGTHQQLMAQGGRYAELYRLQAGSYA